MKITDEHRTEAARLASRPLGAFGQSPAAASFLAAVERIGQDDDGDFAIHLDDYAAWAEPDEGYGPTVRVSGEAAFSPDGARARAYELLVLADLAEVTS